MSRFVIKRSNLSSLLTKNYLFLRWKETNECVAFSWKKPRHSSVVNISFIVWLSLIFFLWLSWVLIIVFSGFPIKKTPKSKIRVKHFVKKDRDRNSNNCSTQNQYYYCFPTYIDILFFELGSLLSIVATHTNYGHFLCNINKMCWCYFKNWRIKQK